MREGLLRVALETLACLPQGFILNQAYNKRTNLRGIFLCFQRVHPHFEYFSDQNKRLLTRSSFINHILEYVIQSRFEILSLSALFSRLSLYKQPERPFIIFAFEGGYKEHRDYVLPLFKRYNVPMVSLLSPDYIQNKQALWFFDLEEAIKRLHKLRLQLPNGDMIEESVKTNEEKRVGLKSLLVRMAPLAPQQKEAAFAALCRQVGLNPRKNVYDLCMTTQELRHFLADPLVTGAASEGSPFATLEELDYLSLSKKIEDEREFFHHQLGIDPFLYARTSFSATQNRGRETRLLEENKYKMILSARQGWITSYAEKREEMFILPRIAANGLRQNKDLFAAELSPLLPSWLRG